MNNDPLIDSWARAVDYRVETAPSHIITQQMQPVSPHDR